MYNIVLNTIVPIFGVIGLGYELRRKNIITEEWIRPANTVTYYVALPAVMFREMAKQDLTGRFSPSIAIVIIGSLLLALMAATCLARIYGLDDGLRTTYIHTSIHGNIAYMAYAVAYYALGKEAFQDTVFISSILLFAQNIVAVFLYVFFQNISANRGKLLRALFQGICLNPIIVSVCVGMIWSMAKLPLPYPIERFLEIVASMSLPTALLLIGSGLTFSLLSGYTLFLIMMVGFIKLLFIPLMAMALAMWTHMPAYAIKPLIVLLGAPTAPVTYVMARVFSGDSSFASVAISTHTLMCAGTYLILFSLVN